MVAALKMAGGTSPEGKLAGLKAQRSALHAQAGQLAATIQRLAEAHDAEVEAQASLAAIDAKAAAMAAEWAAAGCPGSAPQVDAGARRKALADLESAMAGVAAATAASASLEGRRAGIMARIAEVEADIEAVALEVMESERVAAMNELTKVAAHAGKLLARVRGHVQCIGQRGRDLRDSGDPGRAQQYFILAEALAGKPLPDPAPTVGDIDAARLQWQQRFGELKA